MKPKELADLSSEMELQHLKNSLYRIYKILYDKDLDLSTRLCLIEEEVLERKERYWDK